MVKKFQLELFCVTCRKKSARAAAKDVDAVEVIGTVTENPTKPGSDVSRKLIPASKSKQDQGELLLWKIRPCYK